MNDLLARLLSLAHETQIERSLVSIIQFDETKTIIAHTRHAFGNRLLVRGEGVVSYLISAST